jgi:hypothetical protein
MFGGIIADIFSPIGSFFGSSSFFTSMYGNILKTLSNVYNQVSRMISSAYFLQIVGMIVLLGVFFRKFFKFVFVLLEFLFVDLPIWFFGLPKWPNNMFKPEKKDKNVQVGFIPYTIRYIWVVATSIFNLSKCILWYAIDTFLWILHLPFRFVFWILDYLIPDLKMTDKERQLWDFLNSIDYYLHGPNDNEFMYQYENTSAPNPDPDSLNLGFHIIHFPNSVIRTCYSVIPYSLKSLNVTKVTNAFSEMINSATLPF